MKTKIFTLVFCLVALFMMSFNLSAKEVYANANTGDDTKDGSSAANAVLSITRAYELAEEGDILKFDGTFIFADKIALDKAGLTFEAAGASKAIFDGDFATYLFDINRGVTFKNIIFQNGFGGDGGAIKIGLASGREVIFQDCDFKANEAGDRGGAIWFQTYGDGDKLIIDRCLFINNQSGSHGGVIAFIPEGGNPDSNKGYMAVTNSTFTGNTNMSGGGGVIFVDGGATQYATLNLTNVTITGNVVVGNGGNCPGLRFIGREMAVNIKNSIIEGNTADDNNFFDVSFNGLPTKLTINNSIIGHIVDNGGTIDPTTLFAVASNLNGMIIAGDPSVAGLGAFVDNHFELSTESLAFNFGIITNLVADKTKDQLGRERSGASLCSAGAVEFFSFIPVGLKDEKVNSNIYASNQILTVVAEKAQVKIFSISGILVDGGLVEGKGEFQLNPGIYVVQVVTNDNVVSSKIYVE